MIIEIFVTQSQREKHRAIDPEHQQHAAASGIAGRGCMIQSNWKWANGVPGIAFRVVRFDGCNTCARRAKAADHIDEAIRLGHGDLAAGGRQRSFRLPCAERWRARRCR